MSVTLARELRTAADEAPDQVFIRTREEDVTYRTCWERVERRAEQLSAAGIGRGDAVALVMDNSADQVVTWFALNAIGALHAPLNTALKGPGLAHALTTVDAAWVLTEPDHESAVHQVVETYGIATRVQLADRLSVDEPTPGRTRGSARGADDPDELETATLLFTSGTTGASKACALSHRYLVRQGRHHATYLGITEQDVLYCPFPLFHIDAATLTVSAALSTRATAALGRRFSVSGFWDEVRAFDASVFNFMGATLTMLWKRDPEAGDRDHQVRLAWGVPMPAWQHEFEQRFGFPLRQVYGLTDAGVPVYDPLTSGQRPGRAGRVINEYEVMIDVTHRRVGDPDGVGEILVRGREPGLTMNGYYRNPDATAETIVDGWVRTGDVGELDDDKFLAFHGRLSDSIRRRGDNLSAFEVEELVASHPLVVEAAAVGVPSELSEEDVLVYAVLRPGATLSAQALRTHCLDHGPSFMAPRYLRFVAGLPKTPTQKVEKFKVREAGVTSDTWDAGSR